MPELSETVKLRGKVTYQEMINHGILPCATSINRDDLTHIRHLSEIVNHIVERRRNDHETITLRGSAGKPPGI